MSWRFHCLNLYKSDSNREILAPKRIYTRPNPNPNPPIVFENCKRILRKSNSKVGKDTYQLYKSISLPDEGVESIDEVIFDLKFEHTLFRSKSELDLSEIVLNPKFFSLITPKKNSSFSRKDPNLLWDTLSPALKKELLTSESPISGKCSKFVLKNKFESVH